MYVGCSLLDSGFTISSEDKGPDFKIISNNKVTWLEAVTPSSGEGADAVLEIIRNDIYPEQKIILRFSSVIRDKYQKLIEYLEKGWVDKSDSFIIAINSSKIYLAQNEGYPPRILKTVFPLGNPIVTANIEKRETIDERITYRSGVIKRSGREIKTLYFHDNSYQEISGILYSRATPFCSGIGEDFIFIHNPYAINPLPFGWFELATFWWTPS